MATQTLYRKANTSRAEATASLYSRFPNADIVSFVKKAATADEAAAAGAKTGEFVYEAKIRMAEFPPADNDGDGDDSDSEPKEEKADKPESSDSGDTGDIPDFSGEGGEGEGGKPKELKGEELTNDLLRQILDALKGGAGADAGMGGPDDGLDLPDVGAPDQGEGLPAPGGAGAPLPPPVHEKSPIGAGAFAHYNANAAEFTTIRAGVNEIGNKDLIKEAGSVYPTHRVAKIQRTGSAKINGKTYNLPENGIAVVTLTRK